MENSSKPSWGGARSGSGRKKTAVKYYSFGATKEVADILEALDGSKTEYIIRCILFAQGRMSEE